MRKHRLLAAVLMGMIFPRTGWSSPAILRPDPLDPVQKLFDATRYGEVIGRLSDGGLQRLRRQELPQAYTLLGLSYERRGELDKAIGVFQLAVGLFPQDINLNSYLGNLLHSVELDDRARPLFERILSIHPNNSAAHLGLAEIERNEGNLDEAILHYEQCLREWKQNQALWRAYAETLAEKRNFSGAATAIERALALKPEDIDSLKSLALFQFRQGLQEEAHKTLAHAMSLAPHDPELPLQDALWLMEEGKLDQSLAHAHRALAVSPKDPLGLWIRAVIALRRGRQAEARRDLEVAAAQFREAPFVSQVATAMLLKMDWAP